MPAGKKLRQGSPSGLRGRLLLSTALTGIVLAAAGQPARAADDTVTNTMDSGSGSLRQTIANAAPGDTIVVSPGLSGTITLGSTLPVTENLAIDLSAGSVSIAGPFGLSFSSGGTSSLNSFPVNTYSGATALTSGGLSVSGTSGWAAYQSQLQMSGGTTFTASTTGSTAPGATFASLSGAGTINLNGGNGNGLDLTGNDQQSTTFSGQITGSGGEFALFGGGGTLTLTGTSNNYTGPTDIFGDFTEGTPGGGPLGATLIAGAANVFSPNSTVAMSGGSLAVLNLNNYNQTIASLSGSGTVKLGSAMLTLGGDNTSTTFSGSITGTGGLDKVGSGTFTLGQTGGAVYSGPTLIDAGTLSVSATNAFSPNSAVTVAAGATLDLGFAAGTISSFDQTIAGLSGAGAVNLGVNALTVNQATASTFSGVISDFQQGTLIKAGAGTLTLTGVNQYQGSTVISGGTLALSGNGSIASSAKVNVASGTFDISAVNPTTGSFLSTNTATIKDLDGFASVTVGGAAVGGGTVNIGAKTLIFGGSTSSSGGQLPEIFNGSFTGSGNLIYNGTQEQFLSGNSPNFTGTLGITAGTVSIGGDFPALALVFPNAVFGGNIGVDGGTLTGTGTILGNVTVSSGSIVRPGGSIGTLTINGNYTQNPGATLSIEVSPTASSKLVVGGAASLAGTLQLSFDPGIYTPKTTYNFLTASSITGGFSSIVSNNPLISESLVFGPNGISAQLTSVGPVNDTVYSAATSTAIMNAQQINSIILDRLGNRQGGIADGQIAALSPSGFAGAPATTQLADAGPLSALGDALSALPQSPLAEGAWFRGIGGFASVNGNSTAPGFTGSTGGFLAGYDRPVAPNIYLGVAGGYQHSSIDEHSTSTGSESSARFAVYGGGFVGPSLITATAGYARDWFDTDRGFAGFGTAAEQHGGNEATVASQWSLPLAIAGYGGGQASLTPKAGVQFVHLSENAFADSGAGGFDLSASGHGTDSFQPYIGAALAQKFTTDNGTLITPEVRAGYAYETLNNSRLLTVATVGGGTLPAAGVSPSRNQLSAGLGFSVQAAPNLSLYATYDAVLPTGNTTEQTVQAGLRIKF